jgi:hypothetical protein
MANGFFFPEGVEGQPGACLFISTSIVSVLTLREHSDIYKLELKYMQIKTTKRWFRA